MDKSITGSRIRARRKEIGLSADALAKKIGVSRATIYRYEGGEIEKLSVDYLIPLARCLNVSPTYLLGTSDDPGFFSYDTSAARADGGQIPGYALLNEKNRALVDSLIAQLLDGQSRS